MNIFKIHRKERICFVHVPKCGGQSIKSGLEKAYSSNLKSIRVKAAPSLRGSRITGDQDLQEYREHLLRYFLSDPEAGLVMGHYPCRVETLNAFDSEWKFVTILRNPVDRFISHFLYNTHKRSDHFRQDQPLDEYLNSERALASGQLYVRYFSHYHRHKNLEKGIEEAKNNLSKFKSVGILENLEDWRSSFKRDFKMDLKINQKNTGTIKSKKDKSNITSLQLEKISELCGPSTEVYNHFHSK